MHLLWPAGQIKFPRQTARKHKHKHKRTMQNKPIHEVRLGAIKAAVWKNETEIGARFNVKLSRIYKDGDTWKSTDSLGRDDLLVVAKVADVANSWIHGNRPAKPCGSPGRGAFLRGASELAERLSRESEGFSRWDRAAGSWQRRFPATPGRQLPDVLV